MRKNRTIFSTLALILLLSSVELASQTPATLGEKRSASYSVALSSDPASPVRGLAALEALVTDAAGKPVADAQVTFDLNMTNMNHGKNVVAAAHRGEGRYFGQVRFMMPGPWRVIVRVARAGQPAEDIRFDFKVNAR